MTQPTLVVCQTQGYTAAYADVIDIWYLFYTEKY